MPKRLFVGPFSEKFEATFLDALTEAIRTDPLAPRIVLVGSNYLGLHLRHALANRSGGHANVRFLTFVDLAWTLVEPSYIAAGRRRFPPHAEGLLLERLARQVTDGSPFASARERAGFHSALRVTFHDLLDGGVRDLPKVGGRLGEIARLFREHRSTYVARFATTADLILDAADEAVSIGAMTSGTLFIYGFYDFTEAQRKLLHALSRHVAFDVWFPADPEVPHFHLAFLRGLGLKESRVPSGPPANVHRFSASWELPEVEEIARRILELPEPFPLHRAAILLHNTESYRALVCDTLEQAGLPFYREGGFPLSETRAGRALLFAMKGAKHIFTRAEFIEVLGLLPLKATSTHDLAEPADWDRLTRMAAISVVTPSTLGRVRKFGKEFPFADRFASFAIRMVEALSRINEGRSSWESFGGAVADFVESYFERDVVVDRLMATVRELKDLDPFGVPPTAESASRILKDRLASSKASGGSFEKDGIFVGSPASARSISFGFVAIPGLVERAFPAAPVPDPLLLDHERSMINLTGARVSLKETRVAEERLLFSHMLSQASHSLVLSHPRVSMADGKERLPSSLLVDTAAGAGAPVEALPFLRCSHATNRPSIHRADWMAGHAGRVARSAPESLVAWTTLAEPVFRWVENRLDRPHWTPFDGRVEGVHANETLSATEVETYARCPYRYFLRHVVRLLPVDQPDDAERMDALNKGGIVHSILQNLFVELREAKLLPLSHVNRAEIFARFERIAAAELSRAEELYALGHTFLWELDRTFLVSDLRALIEKEIREESPFIPYDFEVRFGMSGEAGRLSTDRPAEEVVGRTTLQFRGRIDRVDVTADGTRARVIDYKTGTLAKFRDNAFFSGKQMQLPIYLSALKMLLPKVSIKDSEAILFSTSYGEGFRTIGFDGNLLEARKKDYHAILTSVSRGIATGFFPPTPGKARDNCRSCDFTPICGKSIERISERKKDDPSYAFLLALEDIE